MMNAIELKEVTFKRKIRTIFSHFSVAIEKGKFIALLGPNGTGKSTLLKLMCGLLKLEDGEITLFNKNLRDLSTIEKAKLVSYMPQFSQSQAEFTVEQIVAMGRHPHKKRFSSWNSEDQVQVEQALELAEITHLKDRYLPHLSGGERQLVFLAKAIAQNTPILLLDEPTSDLDVYHQIVVTNILKKLQAEGKTIVAAIHDINFAARMCDNSLLIRNGSIIEYGSHEKIINDEPLKRGFNIESFIFTEQFSNTKQMIPFQAIKEVKE